MKHQHKLALHTYLWKGIGKMYLLVVNTDVKLFWGSCNICGVACTYMYPRAQLNGENRIFF
jgi:hypothetical protein